jgi:cell division protein FtsB
MQSNLLKKQVLSELRRRRYVFYTLLLISLFYVVLNLLTGDMSVMRYRDLREKKAALNEELSGIRKENDKLRTAISSYRTDDFYVEKHAREDFGLAHPDEYIFLYDKDK